MIEAGMLANLDIILYRVLADERWSVKYLSEGVEKLTGYSVTELLSDNGPAMGKLIHPEDIERVSVHWENCFRAGHEFSMEYRILCKNDSVLWISDSARAVADRASPGKMIHGYIVDITARKNAEQETQLMTSLFGTLSECNRVLVRAQTAQEIYVGIAKACASEGRYPLVWIGVPESGSVTVLTMAGRAVDYMNDMDLCDDAVRSSAAIALREGRIVVANAAELSPDDAGQTRSQFFGIAAAAAVPILCKGVSIAVINLYSAEKMAFTSKRLALLQLLGQDVEEALNRLNAEKMLIETERLLHFALDSTIDAVWDLDCNAGTVVFSKNWEQMLGFAKGDLKNDLSEWEKRVHPDDLKDVKERIKACLVGKAPVYESVQRIRAKNGDYVWIKDGGIVVARDGNGKALRFIGTMKNIDKERKRGEAALRDAALLDAIFEQAPVGISIIGSDRLPIRFNAQIQEMFGFKVAADLPVSFAAGHFFRENGSEYPDGDLPDPLALRDFKKPRPEVYGFQAAGSSQIRWISTRAVYLKEFDLVLRISHDISDLINAKAELVAANAGLEERVAERTRELTEVNAELETFSYSLSHDMKAPLTRIESWANVLLEEYRSVLGEGGQKSILFLKREIAGMHEMIRAMLSLAKASTADLSPAEIDFSGLVEAEIAQLKEIYPDLNLKFTIEPSMKILADPALILALIRNLLDNALKFSSKLEAAEISVGRVSNRGSSAYFVRDNGDGFDIQYADRLFGPFQRMHTQKEFPGTGIGLATVQRIVHRHGGTIWVESSKGAGTTFFFTLPRARNMKTGGH